jgi:hypothetical protein
MLLLGLAVGISAASGCIVVPDHGGHHHHRHGSYLGVVLR